MFCIIFFKEGKKCAEQNENIFGMRIVVGVMGLIVIFKPFHDNHPELDIEMISIMNNEINKNDVSLRLFS